MTEFRCSFAANTGVRSAIVWRGDDPGRRRSAARHRTRRGTGACRRSSCSPMRPYLEVRTRLRARALLHAPKSAPRTSSSRGGVQRHGVLVDVVFDVAKGRRGARSVVLLLRPATTFWATRSSVPRFPVRRHRRSSSCLLERPSDLERGLRLRYAAEGYLDATSGAPLDAHRRRHRAACVVEVSGG